MKKLLLHICCAPDGIYIPGMLSEIYDVTCFFYNPNIFPREEFDKRADAMRQAADVKGYTLLVPEYNPLEFTKWAKELFYLPEKEGRCSKCFQQRLTVTAYYALKKGFDCFGTVLTVSPLKNQNRINRIGRVIGEKTGLEYVDSNFKKQDGYKHSVDETKKYRLYRQDYCGCQSSLKFRKMFKQMTTRDTVTFYTLDSINTDCFDKLKEQGESHIFIFYNKQPSADIMKLAYKNNVFLEPLENREWRRKIFKKKLIKIEERNEIFR